MIRKSKKGEGYTALIISLIIGVAVAVLVLMFISTLSGKTYQLSEAKLDAIGASGSVINESFTALNQTWVELAHDEISGSTLKVTNATNQTLITLFTTDPINGKLRLTGSNIASQTFDASYTYGNLTIRNHVKSSIASSFQSLEQTGSYLPIIVLAVIIVLVLGLILSTTGRFMGGSGGNGVM